ncbi:MAG: RNA 2',3'-cyclic phosphodiesterase [Desulfomonilaceae bacterium]
MKTGEEVRAFIAIELPESVKSFLTKISTELKKCGGHVRWVRPEGIHLTLKFLGSVPSDLVPRIQEAALPLFKEQKPAQLHVSRLGAFPNLMRPRVVWAGLEDPTGALPPLVDRLETALEPLGFPKEKRPFNPHLTLGRFKSNEGSSELVEAIRDKMDIVGPSFVADHAVIFESVLKPSGAEYFQLFRFDYGPV